jgi:hypothetical protein
MSENKAVIATALTIVGIIGLIYLFIKFTDVVLGLIVGTLIILIVIAIVCWTIDGIYNFWRGNL